MAFKLNQAFAPVVKLVSGKSTSTQKKKYRYQLKLKGSLVSKHYTKKAADLASRKIAGSRVTKIGTGYAKKTARKTRRY